MNLPLSKNQSVKCTFHLEHFLWNNFQLKRLGLLVNQVGIAFVNEQRQEQTDECKCRASEKYIGNDVGRFKAVEAEKVFAWLDNCQELTSQLLIHDATQSQTNHENGQNKRVVVFQDSFGGHESGRNSRATSKAHETHANQEERFRVCELRY